mmetsp:Transcript_129052/g.373430  ORF Transcript_129052/g.373430 Transcript_129052/m.373430 type:complete len:300 (-) Transcript_129052:350-1249(-)
MRPRGVVGEPRVELIRDGHFDYLLHCHISGRRSDLWHFLREVDLVVQETTLVLWPTGFHHHVCRDGVARGRNRSGRPLFEPDGGGIVGVDSGPSSQRRAVRSRARAHGLGRCSRRLSRTSGSRRCGLRVGMPLVVWPARALRGVRPANGRRSLEHAGGQVLHRVVVGRRWGHALSRHLRGEFERPFCSAVLEVQARGPDGLVVAYGVLLAGVDAANDAPSVLWPQRCCRVLSGRPHPDRRTMLHDRWLRFGLSVAGVSGTGVIASGKRHVRGRAGTAGAPRRDGLEYQAEDFAWRVHQH